MLEESDWSATARQESNGSDAIDFPTVSDLRSDPDPSAIGG